ncbi:MAG: hypothetical protein KGI73_03775 [Patescibacteria group bacterium]|nr:hypothetical protein [Patescibacteria group bacterium]
MERREYGWRNPLKWFAERRRAKQRHAKAEHHKRFRLVERGIRQLKERRKKHPDSFTENDAAVLAALEALRIKLDREYEDYLFV